MNYIIDISNYSKYDNNDCIRYKNDSKEYSIRYYIYIEDNLLCKKKYGLREDLFKLVSSILESSKLGNYKEIKININKHYPNNETKKLEELQIYIEGKSFILFLLKYYDEDNYIPLSEKFEDSNQLIESIRSYIMENYLSF